MNTHPSDTAGTVPLYVEEVVQGDVGAVSQTRLTVQDASKLPRVYALPGETQAQKLESLRAWVARTRMPSLLQEEMLAYIEDVMTAPALLDVQALVVERFDPDMEQEGAFTRDALVLIKDGLIIDPGDEREADDAGYL